MRDQTNEKDSGDSKFSQWSIVTPYLPDTPAHYHGGWETEDDEANESSNTSGTPALPHDKPKQSNLLTNLIMMHANIYTNTKRKCSPIMSCNT